MPAWKKESSAITKDWQKESTPEGVLRLAREGNQRFRTGKMFDRDFLREQKATASGQHPAAAILGCIDSRVPAEIVFDAGIGDLLNARVAGNVLNTDILGSLEFACKVAGARLIIVLGHTGCGAVQGAVDGVEMGSLTRLLDRLRPAIGAIGAFDGDRISENRNYVDAVARKNVQLTVERIREESPILTEMEKAGSLLVVGAMYEVDSGAVIFDD
jgi:carbonic anhydrase